MRYTIFFCVTEGSGSHMLKNAKVWLVTDDGDEILTADETVRMVPAETLTNAVLCKYKTNTESNHLVSMGVPLHQATAITRQVSACVIKKKVCEKEREMYFM